MIFLLLVRWFSRGLTFPAAHRRMKELRRCRPINTRDATRSPKYILMGGEILIPIIQDIIIEASRLSTFWNSERGGIERWTHLFSAGSLTPCEFNRSSPENSIDSCELIWCVFVVSLASRELDCRSIVQFLVSLSALDFTIMPSSILSFIIPAIVTIWNKNENTKIRVHV